MLKPALDQFMRQVDAIKKQLEYAERRAINDIGKAVQEGLKDEIKRVFDRPTKTTINSVKFWPARPIKGPTGTTSSEAVVFIQNTYGSKNKEKSSSPALTPEEYLEPQIFGGSRDNKRYELRMIRAGVMPSGEGFLVPSKSAPFDKHGNVLFKSFSGMLSDIKATNNWNDTGRYYARRKGKTRSQKDRGSTYFFGTPGWLGGGEKSKGIWERDNMTGEITPILIFKQSAPHYKKRFKLYETAERIVAGHLEKAFAERINHAMQTAR
jgi:hypothetical protein